MLTVQVITITTMMHESPAHATRNVGDQWFETRVRGGNVQQYNDHIKLTSEKIKENDDEKTKCADIEYETGGVIVEDDR